MSPQTMEHDAMVEEINERIRDIDRDTTAAGVCRAHESMARGVCTLLRCERAAMAERSAQERDRVANIATRRKETFAIAAIVATLVGSIIGFFGK